MWRRRKVTLVRECNCWCNWGNSSLRHSYPEAYLADLRTARGDPNKLGTILETLIERGDRTIHFILVYTSISPLERPSATVRAACEQIIGIPTKFWLT